MNGRTVLALVLAFLVVFVLPFSVDAQKFPEGEYKYSPKSVPSRPTLSSDDSGLKSIQGDTRDFEKVHNFPKHSWTYTFGQKVAHLFVDGGLCSGFLVGPDLLMTNHHCVFKKGTARRLQNFKVYMDYYDDLSKGDVSAGVTQILKSSKKLDYALLRLDKPIGNAYGWLDLTRTSHLDRGTNVAIIQHPDGRSKEIVRRNSSITQVYADRIHYQADTQGGSSGSPVFSGTGADITDKWTVIAIHCAGMPGYANEGILMNKIVPEIKRFLDTSAQSRMAVIPDGFFQYGNRSAHLITYHMDRYEVTNAQYKQFVDANPAWRKDRIQSKYHDGRYLRHWKGNNYPEGKADHPVVNVSWYAAMAYAKWVGKRLPLSGEWFKAAHARLPKPALEWLWDADVVNLDHFSGNRHRRTAPVGSYPANGYGLFDIFGNVEEWCLDKHRDTSIRLSTDPEDDYQSNDRRAVRGGSWINSPDLPRPQGDRPTSTRAWRGFRCVMDGR